MPNVRGLPSTIWRARVEQIGQQIAKAAVRIVDPHLGRAAGECAFNRGVGFERHPAACGFVFAVARARLLRMKHAGNAFDIGGNEDFHQGVGLRS